MKDDRRLGRRDRQALAEAVFAFCRHAALARAVLTLAAHGTLPAGRSTLATLGELPLDRSLSIVIARYGREDWPLRGIDRYTLGAKLGSAFEEIAARADAEFPFFLAWHGLDPDWEASLRDRAEASGWGEAALRDFVAAQSTRPPMWLRLNHPGHRQRVLDELEHDYLVEHDGEALAVVGPRGIHDLESWRSGDIEIQDWASQQVGAVLAPKPGETVWDACAGGGGKTLQIAARMNGRGAVHASDIRVKMLDEVARRARRAGFHNVRTFAWQGEIPPLLVRETEKRGGFDAVLVDAPCSASGTWRRNPDARQRYAEISDELPALQRRLLSVASRVVRPGGRLVYATCSIRVEENEEVIARFQAENPGFALVAKAMHGCPGHDSDAMFTALLKREEKPAG